MSEVQSGGNVTVYSDVCLRYSVGEMLLCVIMCVKYRVREMSLCTVMCVCGTG